jgi:myosin-7
MRKLWSSTVPGKDRQADIIFHFHQELPKLLRGYHQCTREEAALLAALIYRVKHAESKVDIAGVLKSLLPADLLKTMSSYEWKKEIVRAYNKDTGMSPDEAKVAFLKVIYRWPTYGSAFFEVTQVSDPNLPAALLVAINKQGLNLIQPDTKVGGATCYLPAIRPLRWDDASLTRSLMELRNPARPRAAPRRTGGRGARGVARPRLAPAMP